MSAVDDIARAGRELEVAEALKVDLAAMVQEDPDLLLDTIEGETGLMEVLDALLEADLVDAGHVDGLKGAQQRLSDRRRRAEARIEMRRALIERALLLLEVKSLRRPTATVSLSERAPSLIVDDESAVPARFFVPKPALDRKALAEALAAGDGDIIGARLSNGAVSLTIRRT